MNRTLQFLGKGPIDQPMPFDQGLALEGGADDGRVPVVLSSGQVLERDLGIGQGRADLGGDLLRLHEIPSSLATVTNAEIASEITDAGGQYVFFRVLYGDLLAFLFGWTTFIVYQTGSMAAIAVLS